LCSLPQRGRTIVESASSFTPVDGQSAQSRLAGEAQGCRSLEQAAYQHASVANRTHWRKKQQEGKKGEVVAGTVQNVGGWLVLRCSGFSPEHLWIDWASRGWIMNNVLRLQLAGEGARQPRGGSTGPALSMWNPETTQLDGRNTRSQRLFERLEAENARLRASVVDLMLQIQALRDGARA
jgi:hypothetical protein